VRGLVRASDQRSRHASWLDRASLRNRSVSGTPASKPDGCHQHNKSVKQPFPPIKIPTSRQRAVFWHTVDRHRIRIADLQGKARFRHLQQAESRHTVRPQARRVASGVAWRPTVSGSPVSRSPALRPVAKALRRSPAEIRHPDAHTIGPACEHSRLAAIYQVPPFPPRWPPFTRVAFTGGSGVVGHGRHRRRDVGDVAAGMESVRCYRVDADAAPDRPALRRRHWGVSCSPPIPAWRFLRQS